MKRIYLVRHGKQDTLLFNADASLSGIGIKQAELLQERLKDCSFDKIYSSTLKRAVETSDILNRNWNMPIERRAELCEIDYGFFTGIPIASSEKENKTFFERLYSRNEDLAFPEGENGEMAYKRAKIVFDEIEKSPYENILIVCHGGLIRSVICGLLDLPFSARFAFSKYLENTSISSLLYKEDSRLYYLESLNDYTHLKPFKELLRNR